MPGQYVDCFVNQILACRRVIGSFGAARFTFCVKPVRPNEDQTNLIATSKSLDFWNQPDFCSTGTSVDPLIQLCQIVTRNSLYFRIQPDFDLAGKSIDHLMTPDLTLTAE